MSTLPYGVSMSVTDLTNGGIHVQVLAYGSYLFAVNGRNKKELSELLIAIANEINPCIKATPR